MMNPNKNSFTDITKFPKEYKAAKLSDPKQSYSHDKESEDDSAYSRTLSDKYN